MFAKATRNFVKQIDPDGCLIPVTRVNNSDKLLPLSLVIKRNSPWPWQHTKYLPTGFTLNDVLLGEALSAEVTDVDFVKFDGKYSDYKSGKLDAGVMRVKVSAEGMGSTKLESSFGILKKQEVDVQKLLQDCKHRLVNVDHALVQQTRKKRNEVFGVVTERIFTTQPSVISEQYNEQGSCITMLGLRGPHAVKVRVKEEGSLEAGRDVSIEIPPQTVIAYSLMELEVRRSGELELCLLPNILGGFESDSTETSQPLQHLSGQMEIDGPISAALGDDVPFSILGKELEVFRDHFYQLAGLQAPIRCKLLQLLKEAMADSSLVSLLETELYQWSPVGTLDLSDGDGDVTGQQLVQDLQLLLKPDAESDVQTNGSASSLHNAVYLLVSALDEMTDVALEALEYFSTPPLLKALHSLVNHLTGEVLLDNPVAVLSSEESYQQAEKLFSSCGVILHRDVSTLWGESAVCSGRLPLAACVAVRALASLGRAS